jgi:hypothetical protein
MNQQRRNPPNGYAVYEVTLTGETPLLMSSAEIDRESDIYKDMRTLATQRKRTSEQDAQLRQLEWHTRIYHDEDLGPYMPGKNIKEMLRAAATKWKLGEVVKRSLVVPDYRIPLSYSGPRDLDDLWAEGYRYTTMVRNSGIASGMVERTRPCFEEWSLTFEVAFDTEELDEEDFTKILARSEKYGLGDYRPEFGAFTATAKFVRRQQVGLAANGTKKRDPRAESAQTKHAERITA